jgi:hypothetical protein
MQNAVFRVSNPSEYIYTLRPDNSFDFIRLFLKFSPIIPQIIPHSGEPRPGENKNFIDIMGCGAGNFVKIFNLFEICIMVKETNNE